MQIFTELSRADSSSLGIRKYSPWKLTLVEEAGKEVLGLLGPGYFDKDT